MLPPKSPLPLPIFELNEGSRYSWKFCKETPRLSLDSRATFDAAKGSLKPKEIRTNASILSTNRCDNCSDGADTNRSPSVIARLMGLDQLPNSSSSVSEPQFRRSASESRVSRDIFQHRMTEHHNNNNTKSINARKNQTNEVASYNTTTVIRNRNVDPSAFTPTNMNKFESINKASNRGFKSLQQRKSFYDSTDIFPEPKQTVSIYGEIEKRLRMRGIDEPSKDLETLKQILEAMQLKGLLHTKKPSSPSRNNKNFVFDRSYSFASVTQSPVVLMKPLNRRVGDESPPSTFRSKSRNDSVSSRERTANSPTRGGRFVSSSPTRNENRASNLLVGKKKLTVETQRRENEYSDNSRRASSPGNSPRITPRRNGVDQTVTNRSPRNRKPVGQIYAKEKIGVIEDESCSSISESTSVSTLSQTDTEVNKFCYIDIILLIV